MKTIHLIVEGMRCRRCVRQATALLRDVAGVATVVANSKTSRITVTGQIDGQKVLAALTDTPFSVQIEEGSREPQAVNVPDEHNEATGPHPIDLPGLTSPSSATHVTTSPTQPRSHHD